MPVYSNSVKISQWCWKRRKEKKRGKGGSREDALLPSKEPTYIPDTYISKYLCPATTPAGRTGRCRTVCYHLLDSCAERADRADRAGNVASPHAPHMYNGVPAGSGQWEKLPATCSARGHCGGRHSIRQATSGAGYMDTYLGSTVYLRIRVVRCDMYRTDQLRPNLQTWYSIKELNFYQIRI